MGQPLTTYFQMVQGKTKFFVLHLQPCCTFEIISRVKIIFQKKGKRDIRDSEYRQLFQEVLKSRANKWGSCWKSKWAIQRKKIKFYLRWRNNTTFVQWWKWWHREPKLMIQDGQVVECDLGLGRWDLMHMWRNYIWQECGSPQIDHCWNPAIQQPLQTRQGLRTWK